MKKLTVCGALLLAVVGSYALADAIAPNAVVVNGDTAKALNAMILKVTGQTPQEYRGRKIVNAKADVFCSEFPNGETSCQVTIVK